MGQLGFVEARGGWQLGQLRSGCHGYTRTRVTLPPFRAGFACGAGNAMGQGFRVEDFEYAGSILLVEI